MLHHETRVLVEGLLGPDLPGAACRGQAPEFDDQLLGETDGERDVRHRRAVAVCQRCPALLACRAVLAELGRGDHGIWAGEVRLGPPPRGSRRPRRAG